MFDIKVDCKTLEFLRKWHSSLKENKINSKLVAQSSYTFITVLIANCFISCFLVNSIILKGMMLFFLHPAISLSNSKLNYFIIFFYR
jgi:hypothetical protein